jgi:valyl-tRNA synthetase
MAVVTKGKTFASGEVVTPNKVHELVDNATVTGIVNADIDSAAAIAHSKLANVTGARALGHDQAAPPSAVALMGQLKILVPMAGLIDVEAELARLGKKRDKAAQDVARSEAKLSRADFVDHAPEAIVAQERERLAVACRELEQLEGQLEKVALLR